MKTSKLSRDLLLKEMRRSRIRLNTSLADRVKELCPNEFFAKQIQKRIQKGRKIRSLLFLATTHALNPKTKWSTLLDICLSIEMLHAASCLVDDILDGDDIRHGYQSSHAVLGTPVSVLQAHFLSAEALKLVSRWNEVSKLLINTYHRLTVGEAYDIFLPEPTSAWMCKGYTERVYQKTSAMFEFSLETAALVAEHGNLRGRLKLLGGALGKLYQLSNDYYDMQPRNIRKRHGSNHSWRITFSLPVACYLKLYGTGNVCSELNKGMLTYGEWMSFLKKIWTANVQKLAHKMLTDTGKEVTRLTKRSGLPLDTQKQLFGLVDIVMQENFWYHSYAE